MPPRGAHSLHIDRALLAKAKHKCIVATCALMLSPLGITGCGTDTSGTTVIAVRGRVITKAYFEHWMSVTAARDYQLLPRGPVPSWVHPVPPGYSACIAHVRSTAASPQTGSSTSTAGSPKLQCEHRYGELRMQVLDSLTTAEWLISEARELGFTASPAEVKAHFESTRRNLFPSEAVFQKYLTYTGETLADQLFRSEIKVYSAKLEQRARSRLARGEISQSALASQAASLPLKWRSRTTCSTGYVLPNCREYKGTAAPTTELL